MEPPLNLTAVMTQMVGSTNTACPCCNHSQQQQHDHSNSNEYVAVAREPGEPPIYIRTSEFDVSVKVDYDYDKDCQGESRITELPQAKH